jgi:hypothetical protein
MKAALLFPYSHVLGTETGDPEEAICAKKPGRLPVVRRRLVTIVSVRAPKGERCHV